MNKLETTCPLFETCPLFKGTLQDQIDRITYIRSSYCDDDYKHCARYIVSTQLDKDKVPDSLLPQDIFDATKMINQY